MTAGLRVTVIALALLVCGLAGLGLSLLASPYDPDTTSGGWFFVFLAAAMAGLTVATLRGSFRAWLAICIIAALVVLVPAAFWLSDKVDDLTEPPEDTILFTSTAVASTELSPAITVGEVSSYAAFLSAACAVVLLLQPSVRRMLR